MRTLLLVACVLVSGLGAAERVTFGEVDSVALGRRLPLAVVLPTRPAQAETPVLFLLHGRGRHHRSLLESPAARAALLEAPFIIVLPQGEDGWYVDAPAPAAGRYGAYLEEVVAWAEKNLPITHRRTGRGIAGWSMGGYGAMRFAQTHAGQFGFVASVIGLLDFPRPEDLAEGQNYRVPRDRFSDDPAVWERFNPIRAVPTLRGTAVTLVLATRGFERTMNENFLHALAGEGIAARVHTLEGGHEFAVVERALPLVLGDAARAFAGATAEP